MKKISPSLLGFVIAMLIGIAAFVAYSTFLQKKSEYLIDNPGKESLVVNVDKEVYKIAPGQQISIDLSKGEHSISSKTERDSVIFSNQKIKVTKPRGVLNPTLSPYFVFSLPYGVEVNVDSIFKDHSTVYQGKKYYGEISIDSIPYMENFYYNLNENFPGVTLKSANNTLRTKIFRKDDFKQYYFENHE